MDPLFRLTISWSLALLFAAAAAAKLRSFREWPEVLRNYRLLPELLVPAVALALPALELGIAVLLLVPAAQRFAAPAGALLLALFALAIAVNLARGRRAIDCGCFGGRLRQTIAGWMVARNAMLAALALALLAPSSSRPLAPAELLIAAGAALTLALLYPALTVALTPLRAARSSA